MPSILSRALAGKRADAPRLTGRQRFRAWWLALRPPFFIVDLIPVGLGGALAAQISVAILGLLAATLLIGWGLIAWSGQDWLWGPVVFAIFSAIFYVAPPIRYGCRGYGELFVCLNMGFVMVIGSYAVMAKGFSVQSLAFALPVGLMVAGILYYQSLPEIETDLAAGKRTLANILGKSKAELVFRLWWPAVWVLMANLWACGLVGWPVFLGLLTFPLYWRACRLIRNAVDWLELDRHGHLVRKLYLINGACLIAAVIWWR